MVTMSTNYEDWVNWIDKRTNCLHMGQLHAYVLANVHLMKII